ncbi:serine-rich adhesin for platelets-like [Rhagoletis pomonella]|uniref:serine-rich adhesin for platelets-like n=1 Tax=Rhagoletis pomonella TaxID=28610 RepID=UPI001782DED3|nr:serine-rich adhesin for platelets-like [Rhagoletis pomonella]
MVVSPQLESPILKRLRAETPAKRQEIPSRTPSSISASAVEQKDDDAANEKNKEEVPKKRGRGRPRTRSETTAEPMLNEPRNIRPTTRASSSKRALSATRSRSATRTRSIRRTTSAAHTRSVTSTSSIKGAPSNTRTDGGQRTRTVSAMRTVPITRSASVSRTRSGAVTDAIYATRTDANARTKSASRANISTITVVAASSRAEDAQNNTSNTSTRADAHTSSTLVAGKSVTDEANISTTRDGVSEKSPQPTGMMTRRRLSMSGGRLDDGADASAKPVVSEAPDTAPRRRSLRTETATVKFAAAPPNNEVDETKKSKIRMQPSRIPVRASSSKLATSMKTKIATRVSSSSLALAPRTVESNSSSGSGSSGTEETMRTLGAAMLRRRALATKMTRINLAQRTKGNPMPMELAKPARVRTPVKNVPSVSKLRPRKP